ncbi:DUF3027 domain-containing protein [Auritidibacter ignavus]|uniref:DUF3027 domain-containing protein n=1 Tax=Auritidibacter ignavus TaxID=678932 RepID=UPI00109C58C6|nr:DUF3027 domain-containing protein [Auritidibacter ignavus]
MISTPKLVADVTVNPEDGTAFPVFGPPRRRIRRPRHDELLIEAVEVARSALLEITHPAELGDHLSAEMDDERLATHRFVAQLPGYRGWNWFVTVARAPRSKTITVCELGLLPGEDALLAPEWVPWEQRASEEERIRLKAIADGEDPQQALKAAGFDPEAVGTDAEHSDSADKPRQDIAQDIEASQKQFGAKKKKKKKNNA